MKRNIKNTLLTMALGLGIGLTSTGIIAWGGQAYCDRQLQQCMESGNGMSFCQGEYYRCIVR